MRTRSHGLLALLGLSAAILAACPCQAQETSLTASQNERFVLPEGFFPVMCWEPPGRHANLFDHPDSGLASLADCGFTLVGFVDPDLLDQCEKLGLKAIVKGKVLKQWQKLSDTQIEAAVKAMVDQSSASKALLGYYITDEPGVGEFPALGKAVAAVKRLAPAKLAYINLYPNYATLGAPDLSQLGTASYTEYLERYVREVKPQFISYDNYQVLSSKDLKDPKRVASYYRNLLEVRRVAQEHDLPFWNIVSSNQIRPNTPVPSPANLLFQAYTSLAAGAQCVTWFTYYQYGYHYAPVSTSGSKTLSWSYLKMVNDQLKVVGPKMRGLRSTGVYFTSPSPAESLPKLPGQLVRDVETSAPLMIGEFSGAKGETYAMVVNLSLEQSTHLTMRLHDGSAKLLAISPVDGSLQPTEPGNGFWLASGQGVLVKFE